MGLKWKYETLFFGIQRYHDYIYKPQQKSLLSFFQQLNSSFCFTDDSCNGFTSLACNLDAANMQV